MVFHKAVENIYKKQMLTRCDETGLVHYFTHKDFDGLRAQSYTFRSSLGHTMQGCFYSYDGCDTEKLVVFEHGFGGGHLSYMKEIEKLCSRGYRVFAYDHTGCMKSGGEGAMGFSQSLHDLDDALKALKADNLVNTDNIFVIGHSWGGYSALNIAALHPDVKKAVVLSGFISVDKIIEQNFSGVLKGYRKYIYNIEKINNPEYVDYDARDSLKNADTQAMLIYSDNDYLVNKAVHYDALFEALKDNDNITFVLEKGKGHNPNYTEDAVARIIELTERTKNEAKKLKSAEEKKAFKDSFDWDKMTVQDDALWQRIFDFLRD